MKITLGLLPAPVIDATCRMIPSNFKTLFCRRLHFAQILVSTRYYGALLTALLLTGCAIGPDQLASSRMAYNDAVQITEQRELLRNIIRLRYLETPEFLSINSISSQFELNTTVSIGSELDGDGNLTSVQPQAELVFADRPTITFTPQQGQEFTRQLIAPVGPETLYRLIEYGWGLDRIFELAVRQINRVGTPIGLTREASDSVSSPELRKVISTIAEWQRRGRVTLALRDRFEVISPAVPASAVAAADIVDAAKDGYRVLAKDDGYVLARKAYHLTLHLDASLAQTDEWRRLARDLDIDPYRENYTIDLADKRGQHTQKASDTLYLATRSPFGIMAHLAQGVSVPITDIERNEVAPIETSLASVFRIQAADEKPRNAYLAVPHRGHWFYMPADDLASRRSLGALISLLELFYDLIFVVAIAKAVHTLGHAHHGQIESNTYFKYVLIMIPLWWAWTGHTLFANRFDTDDTFQRLMTFVQMVAAASLAVFIDPDFDPNYHGFLLSYVAIRGLLVLMYGRAAMLADGASKKVAQFLGMGFTAGLLISLSSLLFEGPWKYAVLYFGIVFDLILPLLGQRYLARAPVESHHMPERYALLTIILLGESVANLVASFESVSVSVQTVIASLAGFFLIMAIWWVYYENLESRIYGRALGTGQAVIYLHLAIFIGLGGIATMIRFAIDPVLALADYKLLVGLSAAVFLAALQLLLHTFTRKRSAGRCCATPSLLLCLPWVRWLLRQRI